MLSRMYKVLPAITKTFHSLLRVLVHEPTIPQNLGMDWSYFSLWLIVGAELNCGQTLVGFSQYPIGLSAYIDGRSDELQMGSGVDKINFSFYPSAPEALDHMRKSDDLGLNIRFIGAALWQYGLFTGFFHWLLLSLGAVSSVGCKIGFDKFNVLQIFRTSYPLLPVEQSI